MPASSLAPRCLIFNQKLSSFWFYSWVCFKLCFSLLTKVRIQGSLNQGEKASSLSFCFLTLNFSSLFSFIIFMDSEHIKNAWELFGSVCFCMIFFFQWEIEISFVVPRVSAGTRFRCLWWIQQTFWTAPVCWEGLSHTDWVMFVFLFLFYIIGLLVKVFCLYRGLKSGIRCSKFSLNQIFKIFYHSPNYFPSLALFQCRPEIVAVHAPLGGVEMINWALKSVLRGEKKHFVQVWSICFSLFVQVPDFCSCSASWSFIRTQEEGMSFSTFPGAALLLPCAVSSLCTCKAIFSFQAPGKRGVFDQLTHLWVK